MIIESIFVSQYSSILEENLYCEDLTVLVGSNGYGKSSFVKVLNLFYTISPKVALEDFYNNNMNREIVIAVTFKDLSGVEKGTFR